LTKRNSNAKWRERGFGREYYGTITANLKEMLVVAKLAASHCTMKFFGQPMSFSVGAVGRITWANRRKSRPGIMNEPKDFLSSHGREKPRLARHTEGRRKVG